MEAQMLVLIQNRVNVFLALIFFQLCCSTILLAESYNRSQNNYSKSFAKLVAEENRVRQQLKTSPDNPDLLIEMAKIKEKVGRYKDAIWYLHKAQQMAPGYEDIYLLEAIMLSKMKSKYACQHKRVFENKYMTQAGGMHQNKIRQILNSSNRNYVQLESGLAYDELSNNRGHWNEYFVNVEYSDCLENSYYGGYTEVKRYNIGDSEFYAGIAIPNSRFSYRLEYRQAEQETLLPEGSILGEFRANNLGPSGVYLRFRKQNYVNIENYSSGLGIDYYFSDYQLAYSREWNKAKSLTQDFESSYVDRVLLKYYWSKNRYVGASYYIGKELNYDGSVNPPYSKIRTFVLNGLQPVTASWSLIYSYKFHEQRGYFDQQGVRVGVRYRY
ncbi:MAG: YaiO family outer membrane beta-barrel protein [Gammaproteobacteria bacterium]|nr:YaiO family outer membrane beta-barrel protein [Gammaproteobacteria bacterium]